MPPASFILPIDIKSLAFTPAHDIPSKETTQETALANRLAFQLKIKSFVFSRLQLRIKMLYTFLPKFLILNPLLFRFGRLSREIACMVSGSSNVLTEAPEAKVTDVSPLSYAFSVLKYASDDKSKLVIFWKPEISRYSNRFDFNKPDMSDSEVFLRLSVAVFTPITNFFNFVPTVALYTSAILSVERYSIKLCISSSCTLTAE